MRNQVCGAWNAVMAGIQLKCERCGRTGGFRLPRNPTWLSTAICLHCGERSQLIDLVYVDDNAAKLKEVVLAEMPRQKALKKAR